MTRDWSAGDESYRKRCEAADGRRIGAPRAVEYFDRLHALGEGSEHCRAFESCEGRAEAEMDAGTERELRGGVHHCCTALRTRVCAGRSFSMNVARIAASSTGTHCTPRPER
jgi:hypothetical protein